MSERALFSVLYPPTTHPPTTHSPSPKYPQHQQAPPQIMGPTIHKLRNTAAALGIDLSEDVPELTAGNREFLFTKEVRCGQ